MKSKSIIKIILDITMLALFIALLFAYRTGLPFHEFIGLSTILLMILHIALNWKWICKVSKNLFDKFKTWFLRVSRILYDKMKERLSRDSSSSDEEFELSLSFAQESEEVPSKESRHHRGSTTKPKTLLMYVLDYGILLGLAQIIVTGIMISQVLFPGGLFNETLFQLHRWTAFVTVGMMGIHLLLHWKYLIAMFKTIFTKLRNPIVNKALSGSVLVLMIGTLVYAGMVANIKEAYDNRFLALLEAEFLEQFGDESDDPDAPTQSAYERYWERYLAMMEEIREENEETIEKLYQAEEKPPLKTFLGKMFCPLCMRFCPVDELRCSWGRMELYEAEQIYQQIIEGTYVSTYVKKEEEIIVEDETDLEDETDVLEPELFPY